MINQLDQFNFFCEIKSLGKGVDIQIGRICEMQNRVALMQVLRNPGTSILDRLQAMTRPVSNALSQLLTTNDLARRLEL